MTICLQCGAERPRIPDACPGCGFLPSTPRELAASAILTERFGGEGADAFGTPTLELQAVAAGIRRGSKPNFSKAELARHGNAIAALLTEEPSIGRGLVVMFRPVIILIVVLFAIWIVLRML